MQVENSPFRQTASAAVNWRSATCKRPQGSAFRQTEKLTRAAPRFRPHRNVLGRRWLGLARRKKQGAWSLAEDGIFFLYFGTAERSRSIQFFSFTNLRTEFLYRTQGDATRVCPGFTASRDGRSILVSLLENQSSEIKIVSPFEPNVLSRPQ